MRHYFAGILLALLLLCAQSNAQTTDVLKTQLDNIFQNVNKSQIPFGYLEEYGPGMVPFDIFNGVLTDSNRTDITLWQAIYGNMRAARIFGTPNLPDAATVNTSINSFTNYTNQTAAIPLLLMNYSALNENAVAQNLFTVSNNQIFDVPGRTQSPYVQRILFAASPSIGVSNNGTISVLFRSDLFYTNTSKTISSLQLDFNDGQGYRTITLNTPFTKTYTDTGYKRWKIKLNCTDASSYECFAEFRVARVVATGNVAGRYSDGPPDIVQTFNAVPDVHSGGTVSVRFSRKGTERTLNKPFIVVEGYDASNVAPLIRTDPYTFQRFVFDLENEPTANYNFSEALDINAGYDLVFLDYNNGTDDILRNAALLQQVMNWVNTVKAGNPNPEQNVVMGISMGGLVARYALAQMTKSPAQFPLGTQTRLFISFDSPHRGANTPLSVQYLLQFLVNLGPIGGFNLNQVPIIQQANALVQETASQQMLIWRATGANTFTANNFLDGVYRNMITFNANDPIPAYRFSAVSNGSECGITTAAPYSNLVDAQDRFVFWRPWIVRRTRVSVSLNLKALPNGGAAQQISYLQFTARIRLFFGIINMPLNLPPFLNSNSPANTLPWDGVPGGTQGIRSNLPNNLPVQTGSVNIFFILNDLGVSGTLSGNNFLADNFCFVPIASALDITNINAIALTAPYVSGVSPSNPSRSANFIAQEQSSAANNNLPNNLSHPSFSERNARWLFNEMENITPNTFNCSQNCQPSGFSISGPENFCSGSVNYSIGQLGSNSIAWTLSNTPVTPNAGSIPIPSNSTSVPVTATGNGRVVLTAIITIPCTNQNINVSKNIGIGLSDLNLRFPRAVRPNPPVYNNVNVATQYTVQTNPFPGATETWTVSTDDPSFNWTYNSTTGAIQFFFTQANKYATFSGISANSCGSTSGAIYYYSVASGGGGGGTPLRVSTSPNPAQNQVTVAIDRNAMLLNGVTNEQWLRIKEIKIYDKLGALKKNLQFTAGVQNTIVNISDLTSDIYTVQVSNGTHTIIKQIIIQR